MKFGLMYANAGPFGFPDNLAHLARTAEDVGIESIWAVEHVVIPVGYRSVYPYSPSGKIPGPENIPLPDPLLALTFAAAVTTKLRLATGILLLPQRHPIYVAKEVATLDVLSSGRAILGIGIGWLREEFEALGVPFDDRAARCREYLAAMRALWTEPLARHDGPLLRVPPLRMFPKPVQKPHPPIVFGGESDAALRRVADLGQGWYGFGLLPAEAAARIAALDRLLARRGRTPASVEVSVCPYLEPARDAAALRGYAEAGAYQVVYMVGTRGPAAIATEIEELAAALMPVAERLGTPARRR